MIIISNVLLHVNCSIISSILFQQDMERLRSQLALAAFLQELGEAVEDAELVSAYQWSGKKLPP